MKVQVNENFVYFIKLCGAADLKELQIISKIEIIVAFSILLHKKQEKFFY